MNYIPYVYIVKNKTTKLKYIGVRYAKGCNPKDLWKTYFTSSSLIQKLIKQYGKEDFIIKIIHKYPNNPESAILREARYFKFIRKRTNYLNCCYSSGLMDLRINSKAGKVGGSIVRDNKIGIFRSEEERKTWASMGGKVGGKIQVELGLGIHQYNINSEIRLNWCSLGGKNSKVFSDPKKQSEFGKRGGLKNKGFIWINDKNTSYKYTKKQQNEVPLEIFLLQNPEYKKGRLNVKNKKT